MNRNDISQLILQRLNKDDIDILKKKYLRSSSINYLLIDNLLPNEIASKLSLDFPKEKELTHLNGPQENKYVGIHFSDKQKFK